jgi:hypothetical protein
VQLGYTDARFDVKMRTGLVMMITYTLVLRCSVLSVSCTHVHVHVHGHVHVHEHNTITYTGVDWMMMIPPWW